MRLPPFLAALLLPGAVHAAGLTVQLKGPNGAPIAGAVVTVHLQGRPTPMPRPLASRSVSQQNLQFHPFMLVVPVGTPVSFPNLDGVRHHVYSFSPAKRFELKLFAKEQNRSVTFDRPGVVPLGCNIHDQMTAFVDVVDTPWAVMTDARGVAAFADLPAGAVSVDVWHPYLRSPGNRLTRASQTGARETFVAALRSPPRTVGASAY